jgi:hypothetical protein
MRLSEEYEKLTSKESLKGVKSDLGIASVSYKYYKYVMTQLNHQNF